MFLGLYRLPVFIFYLYGNKPINRSDGKHINFCYLYKTNVELSKISETEIGYWFEVTSPKSAKNELTDGAIFMFGSKFVFSLL